MGKLKIISINARGLRNKMKRNAIMNYFKTNWIDIACVQEAHITKHDATSWQKQWGGALFFRSGTNQGQGEMILVSKHLCEHVELVDCYERIMILKVKTENFEFYLVNVYAPNQTTEKIEFFRQLEDILTEYVEGNEVILTGDFNCTLNDKLDIVSGRPHNKTEKSEFVELVGSLGVKDVWRCLHPEEKDFTWSKFNPFIARRLDFCFSTDSIFTDFVSCEHVTVTGTDHKGVLFEIDQTDFIKGPGYWKCNNDNLKDINYVSKINDIIESNIANQDLTPTEQWEMCKLEIREFSIQFGKSKARQRVNNKLRLLSELKEAEKRLVLEPENLVIQREVLEIKQKLEVIDMQHTKWAQIRARVKWIEEGEENTKYFCSLEKNRSKKDTITRLENEQGELITDQAGLLQEQVNFYKQLYNHHTDNTGTDIRDDVNNFVEGLEFPKLTDNESLACEGLISYEEATEAIKSMKNGSAPGCDGLTIEFIKFFWNKCGKLIVDSFNCSFDKGSLSYSQKRGILKLLFKGNDAPREKLGSWRPITLTNTDYKILAKVLAMRLSGVIQKLVSIDQVGYLKGRNAASVVRTIDDVVNYLNVTGKSGYLLAIDYSKAFDTISRDYLTQSFKTFGFGEGFQKWVKVLFEGSETSINHCGWVSEPFTVSNGIRQGCPFSPLAYVLAVELLAIKIRHSTIQGITPYPRDTGKTPVKIKQLADDTTLFLKDRIEMNLANDILNSFSRLSGLVLNRQKTKALRLGTQRVETGLPFSIVSEIKILGIYFRNGEMARNIEENWVGRVKNILYSIRNWNCRDLSIHGKVVVAKTFLLSQLTYPMQSIGLPTSVLRKVNTILYRFIWKRKFNNKRAFEKNKKKGSTK